MKTAIGALVSALVIVLLSAYFERFVTKADYNKYQINHGELSAKIVTQLDIVIKNQDMIKKKLDLI